MTRAAPNLDLWLVQPVMRDPPIYTLRDLDLWVTIDHVADAHEIMRLEAAAMEKARRDQS